MCCVRLRLHLQKVHRTTDIRLTPPASAASYSQMGVQFHAIGMSETVTRTADLQRVVVDRKDCHFASSKGCSASHALPTSPSILIISSISTVASLFQAPFGLWLSLRNFDKTSPKALLLLEPLRTPLAPLPRRRASTPLVAHHPPSKV
jgi:hypothetical protein